MNARLQKLIDNAKAAWNAEQASGRVRIRVTLDTSSIARGAEETLARLREAAASRKIDADVGITGSWGFCWMEPCVTVRSAAGTHAVLYGNVTPERVDELIAAIAAGRDLPELALGVIEGNATPEIPLLEDHPFMKGQVRRLMANLGRIDPENIDHYLAHGGYEGFGKALEMEPEAIIKEVLDSGLGGRGGGGGGPGPGGSRLRRLPTTPSAAPGAIRPGAGQEPPAVGPSGCATIRPPCERPTTSGDREPPARNRPHPRRLVSSKEG